MHRTIIVDSSTKDSLIRLLDTLENSRSIRITLSCYSPISHNLDKAYVWKCLGLTISDGNFSALLKGYKTISFRGVTKYTAYSIIRSFLLLYAPINVRLMKNKARKEKYFYLSISSKRGNLVNYLLDILKRLVDNPRLLLCDLNLECLAALFSGLMDGDGYISEETGYQSISYKRDSRKGFVVSVILEYLSSKGLIKSMRYYGKPKYEHVFRFTNPKFLELCLKYIYHPLRSQRLFRYFKNYVRNYSCSFTIDELKIILGKASSAYIDWRRDRRSKVLVVYIDRSDFDVIKHLWLNNSYKPKPIILNHRVLIKITEKCTRELTILLNKCPEEINERALEKVKEYIKVTCEI